MGAGRPIEDEAEALWASHGRLDVRVMVRPIAVLSVVVNLGKCEDVSHAIG